MLKLRYFWKLTHSEDLNIASQVLKYRREQFFSTKNGFIHEVFNLCCKYDMIDIWHGKHKGIANPKLYIKDKILKFSLKNDKEIGRKRSCAFRDIYLSNVFSYQKSYHLVEPFTNRDFFSSASARSKIAKALLYPRAFSRKCIFCLLEFKDILSHQVFSCVKVEKQQSCYDAN